MTALGVKKCRQGYVVTFGKSWFAGFIVSIISTELTEKQKEY